VDERLLVVPRRRQTEMHLLHAREQIAGQKIRAHVVGAVPSDRVDLVTRVAASPESFSRPPVRVRPNDDHISNPWRPLALHAKDPARKIENQVVTCIIDRARHDNPELRGFMDDRRLGDYALLIRCQFRHRVTLPGAPDSLCPK
jgi:hypothetical protein